MDKSSLPLEARVANLERTCRRWKLATAFVCAVVLVGGIMAAERLTTGPSPLGDRILDIHELRIIDREGRGRILLSGVQETAPALVLYDKAENKRLVVSLGQDGSPLMLFDDADKNTRIALGSVAKSWSGLRCYDEKGKERVIVGIDDEESSACLDLAATSYGVAFSTLYGPRGSRRIQSSITTKGQAQTIHYDEDGANRVHTCVLENHDFAGTMWAGQSEGFISIGTASNGDTQLTVKNPDGRIRDFGRGRDLER